jgi:uncharacterized protein YneF (UPF0154 family)
MTTINVEAVLSSLNPAYAKAIEDHFVSIGEKNVHVQVFNKMIEDLETQLQDHGVSLSKLGIKLSVIPKKRVGGGRPAKGEITMSQQINDLIDANPEINLEGILEILSAKGVHPSKNTVYAVFQKRNKVAKMAQVVADSTEISAPEVLEVAAL